MIRNLFKPIGLVRPDFMAIKLLVDSGYITEAKAIEALNIAHGFSRGPLAPPSAPVGVEAQVSALQSVRDRMMAALTPKFGDAFDGDFDVMLEAINTMKRFRMATLAQQPVAVDEAFVARLADALIANGWDVDPDCDGSGIVELRDAVLAAQPGGSDND